MNIRLFSFSKKPNSTKRPGMDSGTLFDCTLIENTSVINPTIRLKAPESLIGIETVTLSNQSIVHITDGASGQPCPSVVAQIVPVQAGSGTPSPSNVRPISGFSSAVLTRDQGTGTTPTTYTADFGRTIYGGNYDFVSGILTEDTDSNGDPISPPNVYNLTGQEITTLQGVNNFYCDTGDILTFTYKRHVSNPASMIYNLNYAYIDELQRYYWIRDIRYELGTWVFDLDIDVLASWKTKIGQSSEYVLRSASEKDKNVIDNLYPTKSYIEGDEQKATFTIFSSGATLTPSYVLSVVGPNHVADGVDHSGSMLASTTYYVLGQSDLDLLCFAMMDNIDWADIDPNEISYALQKQLINPYQYLVDCKLLPWKPDVVREAGGTALGVTNIPLGFNALEVTSPGWQIARLPVIGGLSSSAAGLIKHFSNTFYIDLNPDTGTIGPWVNHAPYTMMDIYVEPFGRIPIPDWVLMLRSKDILTHLSALPVVFDTWCDAIAGTVRLELSTYTLVPAGSVPEKITFFAATTKTGSSIPLYRTQQNITGAVESFTSSAQAINPVNPIGGTIAAAGNIMDGFSKLMPELQGSGTMGGLMDCLSDLSTPRVYKKFAKFVEFNNTDNGSPLCKVKTLNTLSGFIQCQDSHFASEATAAENEAIINYLNGGFFYE